MEAHLQFTTFRQRKSIVVGRLIKTFKRFGLMSDDENLTDPLYAYRIWVFADKYGLKKYEGE
jgi:hypothetical protein